MIFHLHSHSDIAWLKRGCGIERRGLATGCFDLFHPLHVHYLERCHAHCDVLIVGADSDELIQRAKGPQRPIVSLSDRLVMLNSCRWVDAAFTLYQVADIEVAIRELDIKVLFNNGQFTREQIPGQELLEELVVIPDITQVSSTSDLIDHIVGTTAAEAAAKTET